MRPVRSAEICAHYSKLGQSPYGRARTGLRIGDMEAVAQKHPSQSLSTGDAPGVPHWGIYNGSMQPLGGQKASRTGLDKQVMLSHILWLNCRIVIQYTSAKT